MEQWQAAASRQVELLTTRLNELLSTGLSWLRSELGVDVGLEPIPPWVVVLAACSGLLLLLALWASLCRAVFRKRPAVSHVDDGTEVKRGSRTAKPEEPKKKKKKSEKARKRTFNASVLLLAPLWPQPRSLCVFAWWYLYCWLVVFLTTLFQTVVAFLIIPRPFQKAQPNGRAVSEPQEEATVSEETVPHHQQPPAEGQAEKIPEVIL